MKHQQIHVAALLHEIGHLQALAGSQVQIPLPQWYVADDECRVRVAAAHRKALQGEPAHRNDEQQLKPVLPSLAGEDTALRIPVVPLGVDEAQFPGPAGKPNFRGIWDGLCTAAAGIVSTPPAQYPAALQCLLEVYLSNCPAPDGPADLSLYARAHVRAAFALAGLESNPGIAAYALIGGELSGIQGFIYEISTVFAAKLLKGRSFYVTLLLDSIRRYCLRHLGLDEAHTLIDSGGKFLLLAPLSALSRLDGLREELELRLWEHHGDSLKFHLTGVALSEGMGYQAAQAAYEAAQDLRRQQPFGTLLRLHPERLWAQATEAGGATARCSVTGKELTADEVATPLNAVIGEEDAQNIRLCAVAKDQFELGRWLKGALAWVVTTEQPQPGVGAIDPAGLGFWHQFAHEGAPIAALQEQSLHFRWINPASAERAAEGWVWYGGARFPSEQNGDPKTFDEIAGREVEGRDGLQTLVRLGYLRMDVDDLGKGLRGNVHSWVRHFAASRSLDGFFKGQLETLRNQPQYAEHVVVVYAGGDDIFAVGRWVELVDFAADIRAALRQWCGDVSKPSLSGGMVLTGSRFPIARASVMAGEAEDTAKEHAFNGNRKDSFTLLGTALSWSGELESVRALRDRLMGFVQGGIFHVGFLQKLMRHYGDCEQEQVTEANSSESANALPDHLRYKWRWTAVWELVRYRESLEKIQAQKRSESENQALQWLNGHIAELGKLSNSDGRSRLRIAQTGIAARWAELQLRSVPDLSFSQP